MVSSSWFRRHQKTVYIVMIFAMFVWGIGYSIMEMIPKKPIGKAGRLRKMNLRICWGDGKDCSFHKQKIRSFRWFGSNSCL